MPFGVTVYSVWKICSKIQIDSLSNTVVLFIDCESAVRAMTRSPPLTGAPLAAAAVPEPEPDDAPAARQGRERADRDQGYRCGGPVLHGNSL